jgi:phosphoribosylanthranilate isomerase
VTAPVAVKICGLTRPADARAVAAAGARYMGLVFFERSPRHVELDVAREIALEAPPGLAKVALTVDMADAAIDGLLEVVPLDMLQLHGSESPERVAELRDRTGLPVMKAVGVADAHDLPRLGEYADAADQILVDAKPAPGAALPGGNGLAFDWRLLEGRRWPGPWMLAGGLTAETVAEAVRLTGARQVDVSSGVERAPGEKDPDRIARFVAAAQEAAAQGAAAQGRRHKGAPGGLA